MRIVLTWRRLLILAVVGGALGMAFAWSGLFNVAASSGHWAITSWFLHYVMRQSVETHAPGSEPPRLDDPALVHRGAGHYATGCAPCHGAPGVPQSPVALEMTPKPPYLPPQVEHWQPNELFWIVRHGVKFTGMPAWVALEREDEVWAMVAFLRQLPEMAPEAYRRLALGELTDQPTAQALDQGLNRLADPFEPVLADCARCHGRDGAGRGVGAFPRLAGQSEGYLYATLEAYADGLRHSGIMQPAAAPLSEAEMRKLAEHYARVSDPALSSASVPAATGTEDLGELIARRGVPADGVPACISCHDPSAGARYPYYPILRGQDPGYLAEQLRLFRDGARGGTAFAPIMATIARRLDDRQIEAVAEFFGAAAGQEAASDQPR
jgi:cytochrome c553